MSDEFPFMSGNTAIESELPEFQEYAWDFVHNKFLYDANGRHIILTENEALKVWIYKALQTERYRYLAYSWQYGIELKQFIGKVMSVQERTSELKRMIVECLMVNPYIKSIDNVNFSNNADTVIAEIALTTIYGEVSILV